MQVIAPVPLEIIDPEAVKQQQQAEKTLAGTDKESEEE